MTFKRESKFDPDQYTVTVPCHDGTDVTVAVFDKVTVRISVEKDKNTERGRLKMTLVKPVDSRAL